MGGNGLWDMGIGIFVVVCFNCESELASVSVYICICIGERQREREQLNMYELKEMSVKFGMGVNRFYFNTILRICS